MMTELTGPFLLLFLIFLYFLPAANAYWRGHHNAEPILIINLFLGWTLAGWVVALAWSATALPQQGAEEWTMPPRPRSRYARRL